MQVCQNVRLKPSSEPAVCSRCVSLSIALFITLSLILFYSTDKEKRVKYEDSRTVCGKDKMAAWTEYCTYGGLPMVLHLETPEQKSSYLQNLLEHTYKLNATMLKEKNT